MQICIAAFVFRFCNWGFLDDATKIQNTKLLILLIMRFYFHNV